MVLTRKEKMADAIASRLRYSGFKARRSGNVVKVDLSPSNFSKIEKTHKKSLFKDVKIVNVRGKK